MRDSPTPTPDAAASRAAGAEIFGGAEALPVSHWTEDFGAKQAGTVPR